MEIAWGRNLKMSYPLFQPPFDFFIGKPHREWSRQEALQFQEWLLSSIDGITDEFLRRFDLRIDTDAKSLLASAGAKAAELFAQPGFVEMVKRLRIIPNPNGQGEGSLVRMPVPELTEQGNSLAIHVALLTARLLLRDYREVLKWKLVISPKNDISFHLPIVVAPDGSSIEPVMRAHARATALIEGHFSGSDAWVRSYSYMENAALRAVSSGRSTRRLLGDRRP